MNFWESAAGFHLGELLKHVTQAILNRCETKQYYIEKWNREAQTVKDVLNTELEKGARLVQTIQTSDDYTIFVFEK